MTATATAEKTKLPSITYIPVHEGDPHSVLWNRHRFQANKPVKVVDIKNGLSASEMVEAAKGNPWFKVEGHDRARAIPTTPETPEQYRSYAIGWIRIAHSSREMAARWREEEDLRTMCGCGEDDVEYIQTIYKGRFAVLKEQEQLQQSAVNE